MVAREVLVPGSYVNNFAGKIVLDDEHTGFAVSAFGEWIGTTDAGRLTGLSPRAIRYYVQAHLVAFQYVSRRAEHRRAKILVYTRDLMALVRDGHVTFPDSWWSKLKADYNYDGKKTPSENSTSAPSVACDLSDAGRYTNNSSSRVSDVTQPSTARITSFPSGEVSYVAPEDVVGIEELEEDTDIIETLLAVGTRALLSFYGREQLNKLLRHIKLALTRPGAGRGRPRNTEEV